MVNNYGIDNHKLHLHPRQVADWLGDNNIAPIYIEVSPAGGCNHNCKFCGMDFARHPSRILDTEKYIPKLKGMGEDGVKSIMYCGEGEPLLHPQIGNIAQATKEAGIDVSFTTNAVLLKPELAEVLLPVTSWIKISCNAGSSETYAEVHGAPLDNFDKVIFNLKCASEIKKKNGYSCTLGMQMILLPENKAEAVTLAKIARDNGADYLVIKPYSQHPQSNTTEYENISYDDCGELAEELEKLNSDSFSVIFREEALERSSAEKVYDHCLAMPFGGWYIDSGGTVWSCLAYIGDERFKLGNIIEQSFAELLSSKECSGCRDWCSSGLDVTECRINCRMDAINGYLHQLKNPGAHVNFI